MTTTIGNRTYGHCLQYKQAPVAKRKMLCGRTMCVLGILALLMIGLVGYLFCGFNSSEEMIVPAHWPTDTSLCRRAEQPSVIMFANPNCACTRASLEELDEITKNSASTTTIVFWEPKKKPAAWQHSDSIKRATSIKNTSIHIDQDGSEFSRFGVTSPGQVLVYGADGQLEYCGNVSGCRQHIPVQPLSGQTTLESVGQGAVVSNSVSSHSAFAD